MPTTVSNLTFFDEVFTTAAYQGLTQFIDVWNARSGGALVLEAGATHGRTKSSTFFTRHKPLQRRDPGADADVTPTRLANVETKTTKVAYVAVTDWNSVEWEEQALGDETGTEIFGIAYGEHLAETYIASALSALIGAIGSIDNQANIQAILDVGDVTGVTPVLMDYGQINKGRGLLGDRRSAANTLVSYSQPLVDLDDKAFSDSSIAFRLGGQQFFPGPTEMGIGMNVVNTDAEPLFREVTTAGGDTYVTPILFPGAVRIKTGVTRTSFNEVVGTRAAAPENMQWRMRAETSAEIEVMGASYTGASNPLDASLATLGNWTPTTGTEKQDVKNGPGVLLITN